MKPIVAHRDRMKETLVVGREPPEGGTRSLVAAIGSAIHFQTRRTSVRQEELAIALMVGTVRYVRLTASERR